MPSPSQPSIAHRVLRVITRLNIGGPSIQAVSLSDRLRQHGFETTLVHGRLGPAEGDMSYLVPPDLPAVHEPALQRAVAPVDDMVATLKLYRLICRVRPAIIHTHMAKAGAVGRAAAVLYNETAGRSAPARLVHTYHGHVLEGYFSRRKTALIIGTERRLARATHRLIAISPRIKEELVETYRIGHAGQFAIVPLGFDLSPFARVTDRDRAAARSLLQLPPDARVITTVGRLTAIKQHDLFLDAARLVAASDARAIFLVAGDGELRAELESKTRTAGIDHHVRFLGWRRDLSTIYAATDVFALTSRNEGTPVALIEAMASGVPGVSTDVGGVRDVIVDDTIGRRVPDGDPQAFAASILGLLAGGDLRPMGARARTLVLDRFGIERLVADITALYKTLLDGRI